MSEEAENAVSNWHPAEERFRLLVDSVEDYAIFMLDPAGYITSWNMGAERIKGYRAEEIIGKHFSIFYPPEDLERQKPARELETAIAKGCVEDEGWRIRKDGTRFWADVVITALRDPVTHEIRGFGKVTRDLTERRKAEEHLRQSEEQFRLLVEQVEDYAIFLLDPEGRVMTWNAGAHRAKGYAAEEIIGLHFSRFYTPQDQANGRPAHLLEYAKVHGRAHEQGVRVRKDGTHFQADVLITAVHDPDGRLRGFSKVTRDITEQIRNRDLEAAKLAAEKANQAKDEFLAVLSHELRTPLTPVLTAVDYLLENASELRTDQLTEALSIVRRNVLLEAQLINDLLDLTRISRGKIELHRELLDLHLVVPEVFGICAEDIRQKNQTYSAELRARHHWIWGDPTRTRQILWNLLNNAVKFTPPGGRIMVRTTNDASGQLVVEVTDSGIGIEPQQVSRIFSAFEQGERTVTRQFGGLGLGLAITRSLVELHHGSINARSAGKGCGATFQIRFNAVAEAEYEAAPASAPASKRAIPVRILLVDDHQDTRRVLGQLLEKRGHHVKAAGTVKQALTALAEEHFDVLLSDIGLPDGTGNELVSLAKQQQPELRAFALSGFGMDEDIRRSTEAGFDFHFTKPIDAAELERQLACAATKRA